MQSPFTIRRALISVFDKSGILKFAQSLIKQGVKLISTGGTALLLSKAGLSVTEVSQYTDYPEIMNGRVKTLHPKIHAGILGRRDCDEMIIQKYGIKLIDLVVVNFYPFEKIITNTGCSMKEIIDNIDIGGPTIVRSAAKNYKDVAIITNNCDYDDILTEMNDCKGSLSLKTRFDLAAKAFTYVAAYDNTIECFFNKKKSKNTNHSKISSNNLPHSINFMNINFIKKQNIRYGENPHQHAAFYIETPTKKENSIANAKQLQGKKLSYNNILDIDTALECVKMFIKPTCVIVKHSNPCGVATAETIIEAYYKAYQTDPISAFGGIIALNKPLDINTAKAIINTQFVEAIIAPKINENILKILSKKKNIRVLNCLDNWKTQKQIMDFKRINGGLLIQDSDLIKINLKNIQIVTKKQPTRIEIDDALFCWKIAKFVKSNAIVYARNNQTLGIGAGQMSRVYAAKIASIKARDIGFDLQGSTMASDAFFPFSDGIEIAAKLGIKCIIQSGGSIRDDEVIESANKYGISMIFTKIRHFRH